MFFGLHYGLHMATFNFNVSALRNGSYAINAIIRDTTIKDKIKKATGFVLDKSSYWDAARQRVTRDNKQYLVINRKLVEWEGIFNSYESERERFELPFDVNELLGLLAGETIELKNPARNLSDLFLRIMDSIRLTHNDNTIRKYQVLYNQLLEFELDTGRKILLTDVHKGFYLRFAEWLIKSQANYNKTILRKIKMFRTVMRYGVKDIKVFKGMDWDVTIQLQDVDASRVPLRMDEIARLYEYHTTDMNRRIVADAFLTSIYTGLRYSDLQQLSEVHFQKDGSIVYIDLSMIKGGDKTSVAVPGFLLERLKPYLRKGKLFDLGENSLMNKFLKSIAKELKLNRSVEVIAIQGKVMSKKTIPLHEAISFHFGRYTYIYLLDTAGMQATYIQQNAGHRELETTQGYLQSDTRRRMEETITALTKLVNK